MKKLLVMLGAALLLSACGQSTLKTPFKAAEVRQAVIDATGFNCSPVHKQDDIWCSMDEHPSDYAPIEISPTTGSQGEIGVNFVSISAGNVDQDKVVALMARFGFSKDDVNNILQLHQKMTRGTITADGSSTPGEIVIWDHK